MTPIIPFWLNRHTRYLLYVEFYGVFDLINRIYLYMYMWLFTYNNYNSTALVIWLSALHTERAMYDWVHSYVYGTAMYTIATTISIFAITLQIFAFHRYEPHPRFKLAWLPRWKTWYRLVFRVYIVYAQNFKQTFIVSY